MDSPVDIDYAIVFNSKEPHSTWINSFHIILNALSRFGREGVALSFNGGKDCTVLLYLYHLALIYYNTQNPQVNGHSESGFRIKTLYVAPKNAFTQVEAFVTECVEKYSLELTRSEGDMKSDLKQFLDTNTEIKAILIGTRQTDPFCSKLKSFDFTDGDWPPIWRVHPILDWSYKEIWDFLLLFRIPYCILYDLGYTSLGGLDNTIPNPYLRIPDTTDQYYPAFKLTDGSKEREGRISKPKHLSQRNGIPK